MLSNWFSSGSFLFFVCEHKVAVELFYDFHGAMSILGTFNLWNACRGSIPFHRGLPIGVAGGKVPARRKRSGLRAHDRKLQINRFTAYSAGEYLAAYRRGKITGLARQRRCNSSAQPQRPGNSPFPTNLVF
jgi:hypothetical protein